jgi:nitroreductase
MDTYLAVASKRDHRTFDPRPVPEEVVTRILDAGRLAGSARNGQPWRFFVTTDGAARDRLAEAVYVPGMVQSAPLVVAVAVRSAGTALAGMDGGRAAQNMMLVAWSEGVASCPNGVANPGAARACLPLSDGEDVLSVLAFGYPVTLRDPTRRDPADWSRSARRRSLDDVVVHLDA